MGAFTLAETLITLAIIGVIAAMTVPTLLNKYQKHTYVVGLKKAYSQLQNAMKMIPLAEGCPAGDYECTEIFKRQGIQKLAKQFKTVNEIFDYNNNDKGCKSLAKLGGHPASSSVPCFYTADGMTISAEINRGRVYVDINGINGPNKVGRDQFQFRIVQSEQNGIPQGTVLPEGSKLDTDPGGYWRINNYCTTRAVETPIPAWQLSYCTARVLEEDAMNY